MIDLRLRQRFARIVTDLVTAHPRLWRVLRRPFVWTFDAIAADWEETRVSPQHLAPLEAALAAVPVDPATALDLGTGTGAGARAIARRFDATAVTGVDASQPMIDQARVRASGDREHYDVADASALPYPDGSFELVTQLNMIPFFDEIARLVAPGGHVMFAYSAGAETPIYVPNDRLRAELSQRGFAEFAEVLAGRGTALLATKR